MFLVRLLAAAWPPPLGFWLGVCALGGLSGCGERAAAPQPLVLVASGDTAGWIVPCGCTSNQSGGLLRRGAYLEQLRAKADVLYVDVGGAPSGDRPYDRAKFLAILHGEAALNLAAHNVGAAEAALGAEELQHLAAESGVEFLGANARDPHGTALGAPYRIWSQAGRRVLLLGVLSPSYSSAQIVVSPPQREILRILSQTAGQWDRAIVLAYLPENELRALAATLPEVDVVLGGPTGQAMSPQSGGPPMLAAATNKGKFLVEIQLPPQGPLSGRVVELNQTWTDHPEQVANVKAFYQALEKHDFTPSETSFAPLARQLSPDDRFAGTATCTRCHAQDTVLWEASAHAHAWPTLTASGAHVDSYCQQCHTTGYGFEGGFRSPRQTPDRVSVGCESCHGPSAAHAARPATPTGFGSNASSQCLGCHDRENSPDFEYQAYWAQIVHGARSLDARASLPPTGRVEPASAGAEK